MALPATHIRFAATLIDRLLVTDAPAFFSGTLYPDSRWTTGVDRRATHDQRVLDPAFPKDDFTLGWQLHCLCDCIQRELHEQFVERAAGLTEDERWIRASAVKVVQDMNDAAVGEIAPYLPLLGCFQTPNGEACADIEVFLRCVQRAYEGKAGPRWADYEQLWSDIALEPRRIRRIGEQVKRILEDEARVVEIRGVFAQMIERWESDNLQRRR